MCQPSNPLYSPLGIEYQQAHSGPYEDCTVRVERAGEPSVLYLARKGRFYSGFGRPILAENPSEFLGHHMMALIQENQHFWYRDECWAGSLNTVSRRLLHAGLLPNPTYHQVIDLSVSEDQLRKDMRKGARCMIDKYEPTPVTMAHLRQLHGQSAGRETRSDETWELQARMITAGEAICLGTDEAASLFVYNDQRCYYAVSAKVNRCPTHPIIWAAMRFAKGLGIRWFEMGQQHFDAKDMKTKGISLFKSAFGGRTRVFLDFTR